MTRSPSEIESVVFDAEPLVAYLCDEPGSDVVESYLEAVERTADGYVSVVTLTELQYVVRAISGRDRAAAVVEIVRETGISPVDAAAVWEEAAGFKHQYSPSLGDAFALATAAHVDAPMLAGADDDFDDVAEVDVVRFRTDPA